MMRKVAALFVLISFNLFATAQIYDPVDWKFAVENVTEKEATIVITADIESEWHVYS